MTDAISGKGDPQKTLQLLWGRATAPRRGPKPKVTVQRIVAESVAIADREGLAAVSTRRVADTVGVSAMSIYTYVPGKDELFDLMLDAVYGEVGTCRGATWRDRLEDMARQLWKLLVRHPWLLELATHRPVLGPNTLAGYEAGLAAIDGLGLDEIEMDMTVTLVSDYVHGAVRGAARERMVHEATRMTDEEWWRRVEPFLDTLDFSPYPVSSRVGPVTGATYGAHDPERAFRFGLTRVLDGLAIFIDGKAKPAASAKKPKKKPAARRPR